jgi:hypothetical protein
MLSNERSGPWDELPRPMATISTTHPSHEFDLHHCAEPVSIAARGNELIIGAALDGVLTVPAGHARVVREESP